MKKRKLRIAIDLDDTVKTGIKTNNIRINTPKIFSPLTILMNMTLTM